MSERSRSAVDKLDNVTGALQEPGLENTGRKLVSRLVLGNDENITSTHFAPIAIAGPNVGYILAIATIAEAKIFHLRPRNPMPRVSPNLKFRIVSALKIALRRAQIAWKRIVAVIAMMRIT
ncbi:hypothetical protein L211DRAFT_544687 [Terfezia boudieri ATCC MYA-4762]|uniref:Uncharacterized protein n=1 Tax=Terfezia boudieri ATCC MYA-4762 TaxID=1051890 RepID=A0A3N4LX38_9PEZI|nr:hypothetical protein L211DRAFT_544687 [Terfezia boudieri ATCC MYA-4762]